MDRIVQIETFKVPPRWAFLKLTTAEGLVGWGEPVLEGHVDTVLAAVHACEPTLREADPDRIEDLFVVLSRGGFYRGGPVLMSAVSGIEQALWDIKGKRLGTPVYNLLGGAVRDRVDAYAWVGGDAPHDTAFGARARVRAGWKAIKMNGVGPTQWLATTNDVDRAVQEVQLVREMIGDDVGIGIDFHGRVRRAAAARLIEALAPLRPMFIEEAALPEHLPSLQRLAQGTGVPLATGERLYGRTDFRPLLEANCVDIIQPDVSHAGGIWETRKIAAMAEAWDVAVAPHCPLGPIALASCLQLDFCTPNAVMQETSMGIHYNEGTGGPLEYVREGGFFAWERGAFVRNDRPGLGIEIDEDHVREAAKEGHDWHNPIWRASDGSFIEW